MCVSDTGQSRVRKVAPNGVISTIAGNGTSGGAGDGGPATLAQLQVPRGLALGPDGSLFIAQQGGQRVRKVSPDGVISTVAGTGVAGAPGARPAGSPRAGAPGRRAAGASRGVTRPAAPAQIPLAIAASPVRPFRSMADPYIDPFETQLYGKFTREQLIEVCLGRIPGLDAMVQFAVAAQESADGAMAQVMASVQAPKPLDPAAVNAEASDVVLRFGRHLESHKKGTVDVAEFFRGDAPSALVRRRLTKLSAGVRHILSTLIRLHDKVREADHWIAELTPVTERLEALEKQQRAARVKQVDLGPAVEAGRQAWLGIYNANKLLVRGLLAHAGKSELLPLIFDDLAEIHRVGGVSDEVPADAPPDATDAVKAQAAAPPAATDAVKAQAAAPPDATDAVKAQAAAPQPPKS